MWFCIWAHMRVVYVCVYLCVQLTLNNVGVGVPIPKCSKKAKHNYDFTTT